MSVRVIPRRPISETDDREMDEKTVRFNREHLNYHRAQRESYFVNVNESGKCPRSLFMECHSIAIKYHA